MPETMDDRGECWERERERESQGNMCQQHDIMIIYIYIVIHRLFRCITNLQVSLTSEVLQFVSKPGWLFVTQTSYHRAIVILNEVKEFFTYIFLYIHYLLPECSILGKSYCISAYEVADKFPTGELTHTHTHTHTHIYISGSYQVTGSMPMCHWSEKLVVTKIPKYEAHCENQTY